MFGNTNLMSLMVGIIIFFACYYVLRDEKSLDKETKNRLKRIKAKNFDQSQIEKTQLSLDYKLKMIFKDTEQKIAFIRNLLDKFNLSSKVETFLKLADVKINIDVFVALPVVILAIFGFLALFCSNIKLLNQYTNTLIMTGIILAVAPVLIVYSKIQKRFNSFTRQFPDALDLMASSLRAGHSMISAFQMVVEEMPKPISQVFKVVVEEMQLGVDTKDALVRMMEYMPNSMDLRFFVTAVLIQREIGGNLAEVLDNLNYTIRERFKLIGQLKAQTAQARLSGIVLGLAPVFIGVVINYINPGYMKPLLETFKGQLILCGAIFWSFIGFLIIRKITNIRV